MAAVTSCENALYWRFHSRDQQPYWITETKESVCIKIEFKSQRISLVHHHGRYSVVLEHQHGRRDVTSVVAGDRD